MDDSYWNDINTYKKDHTWKEVADHFGKTVDQVRMYYRKHKPGGMEEERSDYFEETSENENQKTISYKGRINSIDKLLEVCQVDCDVWEIDHYVVNSWEGYRADKEQDITFTNGIMDGYVRDRGGLFIAPLFQVKIWLVRKEPIALKPFVVPVNITINLPKTVSKSRGTISRHLVIPDIHTGFLRLPNGKLEPLHDRRAMDIVLQIAGATQFDSVYYLGDNADLPENTKKFLHSPQFDYTLHLPGRRTTARGKR